MWQYEPDQIPKRKHHWAFPRAGFVTVKGVIIGKCPSSMTIADAESLLNGGISWSSKHWRADYPQRVYAVLDGTVYRATPTVPGVSYHGFPEYRPKLPPDRALHERIIESAYLEGTQEEVRKWLQP